MKKTTLMIEPETETQDLIKGLLEKAGLEVVGAYTALDGLELARTIAPDVVLMNLYPNTPIVDDAGFELLRCLCAELHLPIIVTGRVVNLEAMRTLMRLGAYDYVPTPISSDTLFPTIKSLLDLQGLQEEVERLRREVDEQYNLNGLISSSPQMRRILRLIPQIAHSSSTVMIEGESGTGKELIAKAIHYNSPKRRGPFIALNCGVFPETLAESELFSHERGAFTGAVTTQKGKLELAYGGTLFLDEIGEMPLSTQVKLLRVLEEQRFMRVGGTKWLEMNARVIAATHRDLEQEIRRGTFREDLFYRLSVLQIAVPPLRERREDIPLLVEHFLRELAGESKQLAPGVMDDLLKHPWRGNVQELRNAVERAIVMSRGKQIHISDFLLTLPEQVEEQAAAAGLDAWLQMMIRRAGEETGRNLLEMIEGEVMRAVVASTKGNKTKAADLLGIDRKKVERRMAK